MIWWIALACALVSSGAALSLSGKEKKRWKKWKTKIWKKKKPLAIFGNHSAGLGGRKNSGFVYGLDGTQFGSAVSLGRLWKSSQLLDWCFQMENRKRKAREIVEWSGTEKRTTIVISIMTSVSMPDLSFSLYCCCCCLCDDDDDDDGSARRAMMTALAYAADG